MAEQVVQWYKLRWQIEIFFRELKSRMQLGCYELMKFKAVERYIDILLMGFLLLEKQRLNDLEQKAIPENSRKYAYASRLNDKKLTGIKSRSNPASEAISRSEDCP